MKLSDLPTRRITPLSDSEKYPIRTRDTLTQTQKYERMKARWMMKHPQATPKEYERYIKALVYRLGITNEP